MFIILLVLPVEVSLEDGNTYIGEAITNYIMGISEIDDWDTIMEEYHNILATDYIEIATEQYHERMKNG